jgi:hypothetical protein
MSVNMMAANLRCSVFSDGTQGLEQFVAGRKQQSVQGGPRTLGNSSHLTWSLKLRKCSSRVARLMPDLPEGRISNRIRISQEMRYLQPGIPRQFHHRAPFFRADSEQVTTACHSVSLGNLPALPRRAAMREVVPWSNLLVGNIIPEPIRGRSHTPESACRDPTGPR